MRTLIVFAVWIGANAMSHAQQMRRAMDVESKFGIQVELVDLGKPVPLDEIRAFARLHDFEFPADYAAFLAATNGGSIAGGAEVVLPAATKREFIAVKGDMLNFQDFMSLDQIREDSFLEDLLEVDAVPIGSVFHPLACLAIGVGTKNRGKVYVWFGGYETNKLELVGVQVASSFSEFVSKLRPYYNEDLEELFPIKSQYDELVRSIQRYDVKSINRLLDEGIELNRAEETTALCMASCMGSVRLCKLLLDRGALINQVCADGHVPMHSFGSIDVATFLLTRGGNIDAQDNNGETPLSYNIINNEEYATWLLKRGANPNLRNRDGKTALDAVVSRRSHHTEWIAKLRAHGCKLSSELSLEKPTSTNQRKPK